MTTFPITHFCYNNFVIQFHQVAFSLLKSFLADCKVGNLIYHLTFYYEG